MIIGAVYNDYMASDITDALNTSQTVTFNKGQEAPGNQVFYAASTLGTENFWQKLPTSGSDKVYRAFGTANQLPRNVFNVPGDVGNEFWYRMCQKMPGTPSYASGTTNPLCLFWNWDGTRYKKVAELYFDSSTPGIRYKTYSATEGNNTITTDNLVAAYSNYPARNASEANMMFDFRIVLDKVAGFIQLYDYTGARKTEVLGKTTEGLAVTHASVGLQNVVNTSSVDMVLFAILANEPTFGMYMMPLSAKAPGTYNDQDTGSYSPFTAALVSPTSSGPVLSKTTDSIVNKRFSYKAQNGTDVALPANYSLLSLHWKTTLESTSPGLAVPEMGCFVRSNSRAQNIDQLVPKIQPNVDTLSGGVYNVRSLTLNKNPFTNAALSLSDLDDFEFGIYI